MIQGLTTKREIIKAFARAMNLVSPEVQHHHDQVALLSYHLADVMGLSEDLKQKALFGGLLHDIGGITEKEKVISILRGDAQRGLLSSDIVEKLISHYDEINHQRDVASRKASKKYQKSLAKSKAEGS